MQAGASCAEPRCNLQRLPSDWSHRGCSGLVWRNWTGLRLVRWVRLRECPPSRPWAASPPLFRYARPTAPAFSGVAFGVLGRGQLRQACWGALRSEIKGEGRHSRPGGHSRSRVPQHAVLSACAATGRLPHRARRHLNRWLGKSFRDETPEETSRGGESTRPTDRHPDSASTDDWAKGARPW
jgi:hypothetical protein